MRLLQEVDFSYIIVGVKLSSPYSKTAISTIGAKVESPRQAVRKERWMQNGKDQGQVGTH